MENSNSINITSGIIYLTSDKKDKVGKWRLLGGSSYSDWSASWSRGLEEEDQFAHVECLVTMDILLNDQVFSLRFDNRDLCDFRFFLDDSEPIIALKDNVLDGKERKCFVFNNEETYYLGLHVASLWDKGLLSDIEIVYFCRIFYPDYSMGFFESRESFNEIESSINDTLVKFAEANRLNSTKAINLDSFEFEIQENLKTFSGDLISKVKEMFSNLVLGVVSGSEIESSGIFTKEQIKYMEHYINNEEDEEDDNESDEEEAPTMTQRGNKLLELIPHIKIGKRIGYELYFHKSFLEEENPSAGELKNLFSELAEIYSIPEAGWNLLKINKKMPKLSFLLYKEFDRSPYPELLKSYCVDLSKNTCKMIDYTKSPNPPILHRKELFVPNSYPLYESFREATEEAEKKGYYSGDSKKIGYKNQWKSFLESLGATYPKT